MLKKCPQ